MIDFIALVVHVSLTLCIFPNLSYALDGAQRGRMILTGSASTTP